MSGETPYLSLVIPAYNEAKRLPETIKTVRAYLETLAKPFEIIVVNDGSTDLTSEILDALPGIQAIHQSNHGKGHAVRQGMLASRGEFVAFSDADLSAPIDELPKLFAAIEAGADVAIGSRAMKSSQLLIHQPRYRELGGKALNLVVRALAVPGIHDTQCGFKLLRGEAARRIFAKCILDGWGFDIEVLYLARRMGYSIAEVPVRWAHASDSKLNPFREGLHVVRDTIRVRMHSYG